MTLEQLIVLVATAVQPHIDRDEPNPNGVSDAVTQMKRLFAEQPNIEAGFVAACLAVVQEARKGWRP